MAGVANHRLESSARGDDLVPGLTARVHDALWLLARQRQFGEFDATDSGSPIASTLVQRGIALAAWAPQGGPARPYLTDAPLEALVESDGEPLTWRDRVAAGQRLARRLRAVGVDPAPLLGSHALVAPDPAVDPDADPASHATSAVTPGEVAATGAVYAGRVLDPDAIAAAEPDALVELAGVKESREVFADFVSWWQARRPAPAGAWSAATLSYALGAATPEVSAPDFHAERFGGGTLDWYDFDITSGQDDATVTAAAEAAAAAGDDAPVQEGFVSATTTSIPTPVTFRGAPVRRYWQFDDARTDHGAIDVYPTELGKLLLAEFTACFAGDWYRLPVRVPYGSAVTVDALVSTDTFGVSTLVPAASSASSGPRPWRMFEHTAAAASAPAGWLLVPPVAAAAIESDSLEEVVLLRDTAVDTAWAVEHIVTNAVGRPVKRTDDLSAQGRVPQPDARPGQPDMWVWRLATLVPENWIPLMPARGRADGDDYHLVQGTQLRYRTAPDGSLAGVPILPASVLLRDGLVLPGREVPREGVTVRRVRRMARTPSGGRVRWSSWQTQIGHGEGSSGLAYDGLHPDSQTTTALAD